MKTFKRFGLFLSLSLVSSSALASKPNAELAFKQLTTLVGTWKGNFADGREHSVNYRLTAGGTVLVETWALSASRESITLYHLDGDALMAAHYCPQGNQPRLVLVSDVERLSFTFRDGTNLKAPKKSHQHSMWLKIVDKNRFQRNENYVENGIAVEAAPVEDPKDMVSYVRVSE
jgi:hypothetical protein